MAADEGRPDEDEAPEDVEAPEAEPGGREEERQVEVEAEVEEEVQADEEDVPERFFEALRQALQEMVESAAREAVELRRRGRNWKAFLDRELDRARLEVRRAVQAARAGIRPLDVKRLKRELEGRTNVLMTRVKDDDLTRIGVLVEAGLFESRSEAAAFLIHAGLEARRDLVERVEDTAQRIAELKDQLRRELSGEE